MKKDVITRLTKNFEEAAQKERGVEYWMARDIQELLGYEEWRNFCRVIDKAKTACQNSGQSLADHFVALNKMIGLGKGGQREIPISCSLVMLAI
jgi:DNA-damage-inducible protein D